MGDEKKPQPPAPQPPPAPDYSPFSEPPIRKDDGVVPPPPPQPKPEKESSD